MTNDLISRSALKIAMWDESHSIATFTECGTEEVRIGLTISEVEQIIDNAPTVDIKPFASVTFDKDELEQIVNDRVIEPIKNGELVVKEERPQGKWLEDSGNIACSHCHTIWLYRKTDFCPHCGADMREEESV